MTRTAKAKPRARKKKIQANILTRIILSTVVAVFLNNILILISLEYFNIRNQDWIDQWFAFVITPVFIINFILTFLFLTRRMVKDIIHLDQGLQVIAEGNLEYRVAVNRQDELGRVASSINHMTEQLQLQLQKERDLEKSKMDMISGISHDLRTPLTSIIGYIELLRTNSFQDTAEYERFIQNAYNKATHLKKLLDDLFEYTRLTSADTRLELNKIDLNQLMGQLLFEFEPLAKENDIHIERRLGDSPVPAYIDSNKLARAIDNLLMNALKYSLKPGVITVRMKVYDDYIAVEVENRGKPITGEQMDQLFDRFYKVDYSRSSEGIQAGSGLGLSIARNIAELHQGSLTLQHTDNVFTFQLKLPRSAKG